MAENTTEPPVIVTGEERPHPALRKLGRACIALVRWQRDELETTTKRTPLRSTGTAPGTSPTPTTTAPETGETGAAHD